MGNIRLWQGKSGITCQIYNRPGITKGYHKVLVSDVYSIREHTYRHIHKFHMNPPGWYVWVKIEANEIMEVLKMMA